MHNDGRSVSPELHARTREELIERFGALSGMSATVRGTWVHNGVRYEDELVRLVVDAEDTEENQQFFVAFKATLLERFEQIDIYIVSFPVDIL